MKLNYDEFKDTLVSELRNRLPEDVRLVFSSVPKLNGCVLEAMLLERNEAKASRTFYFERLYECYKAGSSAWNIAGMIIESLDEYSPIEDVDEDFFFNFDNVRDSLCIRLVNYGLNEKLLETVPHFRILDLAVIFSLVIDSGRDRGQVIVNSDFLDAWEMSREELVPIASENIRRLNPRKLFTPDDLSLSFPDSGNGSFNDKFPVHVITSVCGLHGAVHMLDKSLLDVFSDMYNDDLLIIPSSIHEVFCLPRSEADIDHINSLIRLINASELKPEEILSDHAYVYSRKDREISF